MPYNLALFVYIDVLHLARIYVQIYEKTVESLAYLFLTYGCFVYDSSLFTKSYALVAIGSTSLSQGFMKKTGTYGCPFLKVLLGFVVNGLVVYLRLAVCLN
jgi:hypothetical protein